MFHSLNSQRRTLWLTVLALALVATVSTLSPTQTHAEEEPEVCKPKVRKSLQAKLKFAPEDLKTGKKSYDLYCASCHGEKGAADGPAGKVLKPPPRNFIKDEFKKGTSPFALFNTLTKGLPGTAMAAFDNIPENERWAISHYLREQFIPKAKHDNPTEAQIEEVCIELSNPKLPSIPIDLAMKLLVEESKKDWKAPRDFGPVKLSKNVTNEHASLTDAGLVNQGKTLFGAMCTSCHGDNGKGLDNYKQYGRFPFVQISTRPISKNDAGGTWAEFADRSALGSHRTLPDMAPVAYLDESDWVALQVYVSTFKTGNASITTDRPPKPKPVLLFGGETYDLFYFDGKYYQKTLAVTAEGQEPKPGAIARIENYETFRGLYKGAALPEAAPNAGVPLQGFEGLACIRDVNTSCKGVSTQGLTAKPIQVILPSAPPAPDTP